MKLRKRMHIALCALPLLGLAAPSFAAVAASTTLNGPEPRISERQAIELGLDREPQGTVQTARLENQNGRQVWFLDISGYNGRSRQEVLIDADTGRVLESRARALEGPSTPASSRATAARFSG
jgi:Peptidase propeptide and YPEB domain